MDILSRVFGIYRVATAYLIRFNNLSDLSSKVEEIAKNWVKGKKFAIRAKRSGVEPFTSIDIARETGASLYKYSRGVDLDNPEVEVYVEVRGRRALIYRDTVDGPGGLPTGVEGKALVLFSGGFDSPVAAWFTAKRGVRVDFLHFVLASPLSIIDAYRVAQKLTSKWLYGYRPRLYVIDFRPISNLVNALVKNSYRQVVLRIAMLESSSILAEKLGYDAIVTGESIGQVSSQTLTNIKAIVHTSNIHVPILRPLIGLDKEEIINISREISLYEVSSKTKEYCRIGTNYVTTRADISIASSEYKKIKPAIPKVIEDYIEITL